MKTQHFDAYSENPLEIGFTEATGSAPGLVRITQFAGSMQLFHSMTTSQAREMAQALIDAANMAEGDCK